jgi:hypothetical protein
MVLPISHGVIHWLQLPLVDDGEEEAAGEIME